MNIETINTPHDGEIKVDKSAKFDSFKDGDKFYNSKAELVFKFVPHRYLTTEKAEEALGNWCWKVIE